MADLNQYQAFLRSKIKSVITEAKTASTLTHQGVKGTVLEILISKLFRPLLPSDVGVGTGQIIEQESGKLSTQMDIILYDKSIVPPILFDESTGIFPIESVLYTIEVKTTLNATELSIAHESAKKLAEFKYLYGLKDENGKLLEHYIERVRSVVFALNTDLSGKSLTEAERYEKIYAKKNDYPHIRAICVAEKEYCYDDSEFWVTFTNNDMYDEILSFIGGVTNTYKTVSKSRHSPDLGNYIVPTVSAKKGPKTREIKQVEALCNNCDKTYQLRPLMGKQNTTINGALNFNDPCQNCGGKLSSLEGCYQFINGELV
ncbi:MAG: hypothetical protein GQ531_00025 [Sulfurovum sp.]|nr:hypothetical protein [Sulfurovum sp.]